MLAPPLLDGAVQDSEICSTPAVGAANVGAPGAVAGATGVADFTADGVPVPTLLMAATRNHRFSPFVRPVMVAVVALVPVNVAINTMAQWFPRRAAA